MLTDRPVLRGVVVAVVLALSGWGAWSLGASAVQVVKVYQFMSEVYTYEVGDLNAFKGDLLHVRRSRLAAEQQQKAPVAKPAATPPPTATPATP